MATVLTVGIVAMVVVLVVLVGVCVVAVLAVNMVAVTMMAVAVVIVVVLTTWIARHCCALVGSVRTGHVVILGYQLNGKNASKVTKSVDCGRQGGLPVVAIAATSVRN